MNKVEAVIGLGSNLDDPVSQVEKALASLAEVEQCSLLVQSPFYKSKAMTLPGSEPQPDYINAVALLETTLSPYQLLQQCQAIENRQGRVRHERWGARTVDLDILTYGDVELNETDLVIPHVGIAHRNFVLLPLQAMMGDNFKIPGMGSVAELLKQCSLNGIEKNQ